MAKRSTARGPSPEIAENTEDHYTKVTLLKSTSHLITNEEVAVTTDRSCLTLATPRQLPVYSLRRFKQMTSQDLIPY
jgi:hypothetical protein